MHEPSAVCLCPGVFGNCSILACPCAEWLSNRDLQVLMSGSAGLVLSRGDLLVPSTNSNCASALCVLVVVMLLLHTFLLCCDRCCAVFCREPAGGACYSEGC